MHTERGPDAAGSTSEISFTGDPGGARRRPLLRVLGPRGKPCFPRGPSRSIARSASSPGLDLPMVGQLLGWGLTAIILRLVSSKGGPEDRPPFRSEEHTS